MGRTFLISPSKVGIFIYPDLKLNAGEQKQENYYSTLLEARQEALKILKDGAVIQDVYNHVQKFIHEKNQKVGEAFVRNIGFSVSLPRVHTAVLTALRRLVLSSGIAISSLVRKIPVL